MRPELIYCAGKNQRFEAVAHAAGFRIGVQLPNTVYHPVYFADQDWRDPDRDAYMAALKHHRPYMATVLDLEVPAQLSEVLAWAENAATYVGQVLIIPKYSGAVDDVPRQIGGKPIVLAYSVPTAFGGADVPIWEFVGWPVHLLGGSPHRQMELARYLSVISTDGNMANKMAHSCRFWSAKPGPKGHWVQLAEVGDGGWGKDANLEAFRRSCVNIAAAWRQQS